MRYPSTHKQETRAKLLAASRAIAKRGGFEKTGVDALMSAIGLTGGAFYSHFPSKQALFEQVICEELENSARMLAGDEDAPPDHVAKCLRSYLSSFHAAHPETGCALPTLGPEIARSGPEVRKTVEKAVKKAHKSWSERIEDPDAAWSLIAQCVGALVLARAVESDKTRREILAACRRVTDRMHRLDADKPS
ncbi:TetR/AcrR family transcriptional regulator [Eleftheria terrae]|uniref:TetR/AcrR family transcriptional regulator n=1 Tax=Eleftheria terrae TaxID=1597781 RepID=UPI00263AAEFB|nr:TetR/AcrR family transcriptional regulator [Eleftheria terrae]WKB55916.1 TetR/AcrR family transcriptional regulator [Eleftheria terrae]